MSKPTGIAVIGLGTALFPHAQSLNELTELCVVRHAVARQAEAAQQAAGRWGWPAGTDLDAALADPDVEAVLLLTPANTHADLALRCFAAGKHVLCEKPLDARLDQAEAMVAAADRAGRQLGTMLQCRFRPASLRLQAALRGGELGVVQAAHLSVPWWRPQSYYDMPGRGTRAQDGGGVLMTQAIHMLDLFRALVGVEQVLAADIRTTALHRMECEDYATALLRLSGGAIGTLSATTAAYPGRPEAMEIIGTLGCARMLGGGLALDFLDGRQEVMADTAGSGSGANVMAFSHEPHKALIADFLTAIRSGGRPAVTGREALASQRLIQAIIDAAGS